MAINVVCPGCYKRFQVSDKFAGKQGPCPKCGVTITIPKAAVKIHGAEEFDSGGRTESGRLVLKPIERIVADFDPVQSAYIAIGVVAIFALTILLGYVDLTLFVRKLLGIVGLCCIAFPLTLFGYRLLRDRETLFMLTGIDLYKQLGIVSAIYVAIWILYESCIWYMRADVIFICIYIAIFAFIAALATHAILDINLGSAVLHFFIFAFPVIILRGFFGIGWLWIVGEVARRSAAPPPPTLLGQ